LADVVISRLNEFSSQDVAIFLWAYATAGDSHPRLYKYLADHVVVLNDLNGFKPQEMSNIVWAYATAGESHTRLFEYLADCIVALDDLSGFKPQALSNIMWAYATAAESHPHLFHKLADVAISRRNEFSSRDVAIFLWAYATIGQTDRYLFFSFAPTVKSIMGECNIQDVANIGWAYAVANVDVPSLFNSDFISACLAKEIDFSLRGYTQLHQWQLWQEELKSDVRLPLSLREKCQKAFISTLPMPSKFQYDVVSELPPIGLRPEEEVLTVSGYRLDALVEVNGKKIGIEVDGPSHFVGRKPTGSTILKCRQVDTLDDIPVISVPYWEWHKLGKHRGKKQEYLRTLLGLV
jgi:hypothetical protein